MAYFDAPIATDALYEIPLSALERIVDVLPDGHEALVAGDVFSDRSYWHPQGENDLGFQGTCGLVSCEEVLREFGRDVDESQVVSEAVKMRFCEITGDPASSGGTSPHTQVELLETYGVAAHVERIQTLVQLAHIVERGHSVIAEVNAGRLWNDVAYYDWGHMNHAIVVTGVARDASNGRILGFFVNDSGRGAPGDAGRFVPEDRFDASFLQAGGHCVVTDDARRDLTQQ